MSDPQAEHARFAIGDMAMLIDRKKRRYLIELSADGEFHSHSGVLGHDALIGEPEGVAYRSSRGAEFIAVRPTLTDFVLKMPRGAQVIYPKDLGPMLFMADIHPGMKVLETGIGSGALSMTLLRAGAVVTGYEVREDFAERAQENVVSFLGQEALARYTVEIRNAYDGVDAADLDRVLLDLPEPWQVLAGLGESLRPGGIVVAYTPSITQVVRFRETLAAEGYGLIETTEVLNRGWHVEPPSVRPDHRMVAHTGFLTVGRRLMGKAE